VGEQPAAALALATGGASIEADPHKEQIVIVHALSGAASLAACLRLFRRYPLAVTGASAAGGCRSMVLASRDGGQAGYFVLTQARDDLFVIRSWNAYDGVNQEIRAGEPVSGVVHQIITEGMPVPRDGALLGWLTDNAVTVMLAVHSRQPETWDVPVPAPDALAAVHGEPARRRAAVGVRRVGPDRRHLPPRHPRRRAGVLGPVPGQPQHRARRRVRRHQGQPAG